MWVESQVKMAFQPIFNNNLSILKLDYGVIQMYWKDTWRFKNSNEYEYKYAGKYGAKGEKRAKKKKPTKEQIAKQNQRNKEKHLRRVIKANFLPDDLWITLKYPKGTRKPLSEVKKDMRKFLNSLRKEYKKRGEKLKFIYRMEIGSRGGIHIHILINRLAGKPDTDVLVKQCWKQGKVNFESLYEQGGYDALAAYICKEPTEEMEGQLSLFSMKEKKALRNYSPSRNLIRPKPVRENYRRWTVRDLVQNGPKPTPGYYIDQSSISYGVNPYTGMSYYQYTEVKIEEHSRSEEGGNSG